MDISSAEGVMAFKQAQTQQIAAMKILKKQHEMQMSLINMVDQLVQQAPAPQGTGAAVDKTA